MNFREFFVDNLESSHLNEITDIWIESLPYNIKSIIGKKIIQKYLEKFFKTEGNVGIGLFKSSKLIGFVFFGNDKKIISQIFKENLIYILFSFFLYFIKFKFIRVFYYLDVLIYLILSKFKKKNYRNTTELLIISIKKNYQNKGLGSYLLKASFEKNKDYLKKFDHIIVMTLKSTPENINFYEKNNFKIFYKIYGRVYLRLNVLR